MGGRSGSCSARWREQRVDLGGVPQPCRIGNKQQKRQGWWRRCQCHARPCIDVGATRGRVSRGGSGRNGKMVVVVLLLPLATAATCTMERGRTTTTVGTTSGRGRQGGAAPAGRPRRRGVLYSGP
jgi:hypothetical protein